MAQDLVDVVLYARCKMTVTIQATDLRRRVREVLDRVQEDREPVVIRTYDTPQAVIIPYEDFQDYLAWQARRRERVAWLAELEAIAREVSARAGLSDDEAAALIREARGKSRSG
jgi:prevent-host-death family protein